MEWVETTGKSLEEAKDRALDQLGVAADEAEFDVLEEPRSGLFGRVRGEARVRARVQPTAVRPKQDRRSRGRGKAKSDQGRSSEKPNRDRNDGREAAGDRTPRSDDRQRSNQGRAQQSKQQKENKRMGSREDRGESTVTPQEVGDAAVTFMSGLSEAFGSEATTHLEVDDTNLEVRVEGPELGLMVGPGGRTLIAVQDLARVASQRRLGDHDTRLRIDVGGYREKRRAALETFAQSVATQVIESGSAKALEPMPSADRKAVHDALAEVDGVTSRSEGDDPMRRVVISPA
jgi:spoIIIJ-associated protein